MHMKIRCEGGEWIQVAQVESCNENESLCSIEDVEFIHKLSDYQLT